LIPGFWKYKNLDSLLLIEMRRGLEAYLYRFEPMTQTGIASIRQVCPDAENKNQSQKEICTDTAALYQIHLHDPFFSAIP
jgi:hypothetical protein